MYMHICIDIYIFSYIKKYFCFQFYFFICILDVFPDTHHAPVVAHKHTVITADAKCLDPAPLGHSAVCC